jgi:hypothetical protein
MEGDLAVRVLFSRILREIRADVIDADLIRRHVDAHPPRVGYDFARKVCFAVAERVGRVGRLRS